jgi:hypothetical protein
MRVYELDNEYSSVTPANLILANLMDHATRLDKRKRLSYPQGFSLKDERNFSLTGGLIGRTVKSLRT